jgi:integrase/recombinase XerD
MQRLGKGRKERPSPLWPTTGPVLQAWFQELGDHAGQGAFPNARGQALAREGGAYLLQPTVQRALPPCPRLATKHLSPHVLRHPTARHLLQAGGDIATIALWLGHERSETTHGYLATDLAMQEQAWAKLAPLEGVWKRFHADDPLRTFLASLSSCQGASHDVVAPHSFTNFTWDDPVLEMIV